MNAIEIISMIIKLGGGIALFLFGMSLLSSSLEKLSSGKIEKILEKLSGNIVKSILFGAIVTGAIQSSAATIIIVIGLVNAGILKSKSAIGIVIGANIGTTVTGQILRLNDLKTSALTFLTPAMIAPIITIIGILLFMVLKQEKQKNIGSVLLGLGILFTGMISMENALSPLSESAEFANVFTTLSNPVVGVLGGTIITAILQSSSASIGLLQAVSSTGAISYAAAIPIIVGQNIGACVTPMMSSIKSNKNAKRVAFIHLYFNIIGCFIFLGGLSLLRKFIDFSFWNDAINMGAIANLHTLFNVIPAILFIPFYKILEKLADLTIKPDKISLPADDLDVLDERFIAVPGLAVEQINKISVKMSELAYKNYTDAKSLFYNFSYETIRNIKDRENRIDRIDDVLNNYIVKLTDNSLNEEESRVVASIIHLSSEFERISDHCTNLLENALSLHDKQMTFSKSSMANLTKLLDAVEEILKMSIDSLVNNDYDTAKKIEPLEEVIDMLEYKTKDTYIPKLDKETYSIECGVIYLEILSNLERISDHCSNIALYVLRQLNKTKYKFMNPHEYIYQIHHEQTKDYMETTDLYINKYLNN